MGRARDRLDEVAAVVPAIREATFAIADDALISPDGTISFGRAPEVAPEAYHVSIFPPAPEAWLRSLEAATNLRIPGELRRVLRVMNGCYCFELKLFGATADPKGLLDRRVLAPLRLAFALSDWAQEYGRAGSFYFGGAPWTHEANAGYFWTEEGPLSALANGDVVGRWPTLDQLLSAELGRLTGKQAGVH